MTAASQPILLAPTLSAPAAARAFVQGPQLREPALLDTTVVDRAMLLGGVSVA